jgi:phosphoserine phosphatase
MTWSFAVDGFGQHLGADYSHGTRLGPRGIEHVWPADKGPWLEALIQRLSLEREAVAAVGDSDGECELLEAAGLPLAGVAIDGNAASGPGCQAKGTSRCPRGLCPPNKGNGQ